MNEAIIVFGGIVLFFGIGALIFDFLKSYQLNHKN
jgi:hypothetical protein